MVSFLVRVATLGAVALAMAGPVASAGSDNSPLNHLDGADLIDLLDAELDEDFLTQGFRDLQQFEMTSSPTPSPTAGSRELETASPVVSEFATLPPLVSEAMTRSPIVSEFMTASPTAGARESATASPTAMDATASPTMAIGTPSPTVIVETEPSITSGAASWRSASVAALAMAAGAAVVMA